MSLQSSESLRPPTYPLRPLNGGPLPTAAPKLGKWFASPKYNGWRALVHVPTGAMFNRHGQRLSIEQEFGPALAILRQWGSTGWLEWADVEALERRHNIGRGALVVLDALNASTYEQRQFTLKMAAALHGIPYHDQLDQPVADNSVVLCADYQWDGAKPLWTILQRCNAEVFHCDFYEGLVAKRADSRYPFQLASPEQEFTGWMKHRFL